MTDIYKENYSEGVYKAFYEFFDKRVDTIYKSLSSTYPENECFELEYGYEIWIENTLDLAIEASGYQIECYDIQIEIQENLESDFSMLQDEIDRHNERAIEIQCNENKY